MRFKLSKHNNIERIYFMWKIYHPILNSSLQKYPREFLSKIIKILSCW